MADYLPPADRKNDTQDYKRAKELRRSSPLAERLLWNELRNLPKDLGLKFRRQHPIHPYIADFVCLKLKLVIELDGESHNVRHEQDIGRDRILAGFGFTVLRFTNEDIYKNREGVVRHILKMAKELVAATVVPLP